MIGDKFMKLSLLNKFISNKKINKIINEQKNRKTHINI